MKRRAILATAVACSAFGFAARAHADNIVFNHWYTGGFNASGTPLFGPGFTTDVNGPTLQLGPIGSFSDATSAPGGPWVITVGDFGTLTVVDTETSGDQFQLFNNGIPLLAAPSLFHDVGQNQGQVSPGNGLTSAPCVSCAFGVNDINAALGDARYSSATFLLIPGVNVITGTFLGSVGFGDFDFIAESPMPEPATWAMMIGGFGLAGLALRRRSAVVAN